jgi:hypothetical protein
VILPNRFIVSPRQYKMLEIACCGPWSDDMLPTPAVRRHGMLHFVRGVERRVSSFARQGMQVLRSPLGLLYKTNEREMHDHQRNR